LDGIPGQLGAAGEVEFGCNIVSMAGHGSGANTQLLSNLFVGQSLGNER